MHQNLFNNLGVLEGKGVDTLPWFVGRMGDPVDSFPLLRPLQEAYGGSLSDFEPFVDVDVESATGTTVPTPSPTPVDTYL